MANRYTVTVFDGLRHEGSCAKVLLNNPCSCRAPFPIPAPNVLVCDNCGERQVSAEMRQHGSVECLPCYRATLEHGHMHTDHDSFVVDCPTCEALERR